MAPEKISDGMFHLLEGESVIGMDGNNKPLILKGPMVVRVNYYDGLNMMSIQAGEKQIEVDGLDFPKVVKKEEK